MERTYQLPAVLEPHREALVATKRPFIEIIPTEEPPAQLWNSRFCGAPYLPKGHVFPTAATREHLFFLAQINFAEAPALEGYPTEGILQFYIFDDQLFGRNSDDPYLQDRFRVLFFPSVKQDVNQLLQDFSFLREYEELPVYPDQSYGMEFELDKEMVPITDYQFAEQLGIHFFKQFGEEEWPIFGAYAEEVSSEGHKIGGYAHFAQEDPRSPENPLLLLFQMDTDAEMEAMWGDMGTAKFFISAEDLAKRDFSRVMYVWDGY